MEVRLLGSGGFMPSDRRETACALLRKDGGALAIDAGTAARRLVSDRSLLAGVERLHVVLTHFHLDHTLGLFYLVDAGVPVEVWAAGEALEGTSTEALLGRLLGSPFAPPGFLRSFVLHELPVGDSHVGPFALQTRIQRLHSNATLALRVDDEVVWCTDTGYDEGNVELARGARLLFHEAFTISESGDDPTHTPAGQAARLAAAAGAERLVLIHIDPELVDDAELLRFARPYFAATDVGRDGWSAST
jgi:ribonuclease BN (tRNA processing enzyme)